MYFYILIYTYIYVYILIYTYAYRGEGGAGWGGVTTRINTMPSPMHTIMPCGLQHTGSKGLCHPMRVRSAQEHFITILELRR